MEAKYEIADKWNRLLSLDESFPDVIKLEILKRIVESEAYKIISGFIEGMNHYDTLSLVNLEGYKHDFIRIMSDMISEAIQAIAARYHSLDNICNTKYILYDSFYMDTFEDAESIHDMYWSDILITPSITEWPNDKYFCVEYEGFCRSSLGINLNVLETAFHKLAGPGTKENINHSLFSAFEFCPAAQQNLIQIIILKLDYGVWISKSMFLVGKSIMNLGMLLNIQIQKQEKIKYLMENILSFLKRLQNYFEQNQVIVCMNLNSMENTLHTSMKKNTKEDLIYEC